MMKYNSKIFARSICAVMVGVMMVGGLTGCGNDDAVDGRGMRLEKQNGDKTEITGIAEKYREKESKQKKKSLQDNGLTVRRMMLCMRRKLVMWQQSLEIQRW